MHNTSYARRCNFYQDEGFGDEFDEVKITKISLGYNENTSKDVIIKIIIRFIIKPQS